MIYKGEKLKEISFPLGGIGSGSIGLGGDGRLIDWEIFNKPSKGSRNGTSFIAIKAIKNGKVYARVLNGDMQKEFIGRYLDKEFLGYGYGPETYSMSGFPHFSDLTFKGEFPIAELEFSDEKFPAKVNLFAFNPFIPLDDKNSSIPGGFFDILVENREDEEIEYQVAFSLQNPFEISKNEAIKEGNISGVTVSHGGLSKDDLGYGDLTVATDHPDTILQSYWYRGSWMDALVTFWNEFSALDDIKERVYEECGDKNTKDNATVLAKIKLAPGEKKNVRFTLTWNIPNNYNYWSPYKDENEKDITWKNYYAVLFPDSKASAAYSLKNWDELYEKTLRFKDALYSSTLDDVMIDAVASNLSVLKSPTVLRLSDGSFYGWEGVFQSSGSCEGNCQHVWNYAYALCFLFPSLERSIRDAEFKFTTFPDGRTQFRIELPYDRKTSDAKGMFKVRPCLDGQMGTVIKIYREWKISGDDEWLKENWEKTKKILEYAWSEENGEEWDRDKDGVLEGRQHHTLDMELFGPSSWLQGLYLLALKVTAEMAEYLGDFEKQKEYLEIYQKGRSWTEENLFNGEYFIQKVDIKNKDIVDHFDATALYWNDEAGEIKYQVGDGSIIDQILGQWHADILGVGDIFDKNQVKTALKSMMKYNFKESMRDFVNPWRVYALNDEAGTIMCEYPNGKPAIPISYCEEVMTGFEYAFAGLLISCDMIEDGIKVIRAIRDRYDGEKRNPWNEIECGSNYARSMASFALLPIFSGFEFDVPLGHIGFNPKGFDEHFKSPFSLAPCWGEFETDGKKAEVTLFAGELKISSLGLGFAKNISKVLIDANEVSYTVDNGIIYFDERVVKEKIVVEF